MLKGFALLLVFQLAGESLVIFFNAPLPGPVAGMVLLFLALTLRGQLEAPLAGPANALLTLLPLLFVPAGVGLMLHYERLVNEGPIIVLALIVSLILTLVASGMLMRRFAPATTIDKPGTDGR